MSEEKGDPPVDVRPDPKGEDEKKPSDEVEDTNEGSHHEPETVTLKDVQEATPAESEDYKTLWNDIEKNSKSEKDEGRPSFVVPPNMDPSSTTEKIVEEEKRTVEDDLYHATAALGEIQPESIEVYTNKKKGVSQTDRFAGAAGRMYKRFRRASSVRPTDDSSSPSYNNDKPGQVDIENQENPNDTPDSSLHGKTKNVVLNIGMGVTQELRDFKNFVLPQKSYGRTFVMYALLCLVVPSALVGALLFYAIEPEPEQGGASSSWWIIFIGCRQVLTFGLAKMLQFIIGK